MIEIGDKFSDVLPSHEILAYAQLVLNVKDYLFEFVRSVNRREVQDLLLKQMLQWQAYL